MAVFISLAAFPFSLSTIIGFAAQAPAIVRALGSPEFEERCEMRSWLTVEAGRFTLSIPAESHAVSQERIFRHGLQDHADWLRGRLP